MYCLLTDKKQKQNKNIFFIIYMQFYIYYIYFQILYLVITVVLTTVHLHAYLINKYRIYNL